jgi:hypothetical protein
MGVRMENLLLLLLISRLCYFVFQIARHPSQNMSLTRTTDSTDTTTRNSNSQEHDCVRKRLIHRSFRRKGRKKKKRKTTADATAFRCGIAGND